MFEEDFSTRLMKLRKAKGVSAREMSLSIGQNSGYINGIENGKALPSMSSLFFICEYLNITPMEFFDLDSDQPELLRELTDDLKKLNERQHLNIAEIVRDLAPKK